MRSWLPTISVPPFHARVCRHLGAKPSTPHRSFFPRRRSIFGGSLPGSCRSSSRHSTHEAIEKERVRDDFRASNSTRLYVRRVSRTTRFRLPGTTAKTSRYNSPCYDRKKSFRANPPNVNMLQHVPKETGLLSGVHRMDKTKLTKAADVCPDNIQEEPDRLREKYKDT